MADVIRFQVNTEISKHINVIKGKHIIRDVSFASQVHISHSSRMQTSAMTGNNPKSIVRHR